MTTDLGTAALARAAALAKQGRAEDAFVAFQEAAGAGDTYAKFTVGRSLLLGMGTSIDVRTGTQYLMQASSGGSGEAALMLASVAIGDRVLKRDPSVIAGVIDSMARAGNYEARRALAVLFAATDPDRSIAILEQQRTHDDLSRRIVSRAGDKGSSAPAAASLPAGATITSLVDSFVRVPERSVISDRPHVMLSEQVLAPLHCHYLIAFAEKFWQPSRVFDPTGMSTARRPIRTSSDVVVDGWMEDLSLRLIQLRMATAAGGELTCAEPLTLLHYLPGQEYLPHLDALPEAALAERVPQAGQRWRTVCCYLNNVDVGGETEFPTAQIKVEPRQGRAVIFDNLTPSGSIDPESRHAGLPLNVGEKFLATLWLRERTFRAF